MKLKLLSILALTAAPLFAPLAAVALPAVGDMIGTDPDSAKAALETAGCAVDAFAAEDGKIEAKCKDTASGADMEVSIDPASGNVTGLILTGGATPMRIAKDQAAVASGDWSALIKDGDAGASDNGDGSNASLRRIAGDVHGVTANLLLLLAVLHVAGVFVEGRALRRNLVAPMLLGKNQRRK